MRKQTKQAVEITALNILYKRLKEGCFVFLCALSIFLWVALFTHDVNDGGWSKTAINNVIHNSAGQIGAFFADLLLYFFGYLAYLLPALIICSGILLFNKGLAKFGPGWLWAFRVTGFLVIILSSSALFNIYYMRDVGLNFDLITNTGPGGIVGYILINNLLPIFSVLGTNLLLITALLIGITIGTGMSWLYLMNKLGKLVILCANVVTKLIKKNILRLNKKILFSLNQLWQKYKLYKQQKTSKKIREKFIKPVLQIANKDKDKNKTETEIQDKILEKKLLSGQGQGQGQGQANISKIIQKSKLKPISASVPVSVPLSTKLLTKVQLSDKVEQYSEKVLEQFSREVEAILLDFGAKVEVVSVLPGPVITRFELTLAPGLKASKITGLAKDLARSLSVTAVRVVEIIPGKSVVGLEIPNKERAIVRLKEVLESDNYLNANSILSLALGKDISGVPVVVDLAKMPHLLVAGTTGSGKSVGINVMLLSLLYKATPDDVRLILIDPKMLELSVYQDIGHLLTPVVTDMKDAANALRWCVAEMERRYQLMSAVGVRNLDGFNSKIKEAAKSGKPLCDPLWQPIEGQKAPVLEKLPFIVVIIDEFADMIMVVGKKVEELIARIAQKARAAGIHMILATQRPSVDVITGLIKANVPTRIAFQVSSRIDSRTILDQQGAEQLLGHGDMLYLAPGTGIPIRVHGAFVSDEEVHSVVNNLKANGPAPDYIEEFSEIANSVFVPGLDNINSNSNSNNQENKRDLLYQEAVSIVTESKKASISYLQRRLKIGYNRAACLIEEMETQGIVSAVQNNGSREVL